MLKDAVVSYGEQLSSRLLAEVLKAKGVGARHFDSRRLVMTDDEFGAAQPIWEETRDLLQLDLRRTEWTGKDAEERLHEVKLTVNRNTVPFDERPPTVASGVRIGTPALSSRGLKPDHLAVIAGFIDRGVSEAAAHGGEVSDAFAERMRADVAEFLSAFPAPGL